MFKKSSWSWRLLLTAVAVSQLMSSVAPVKAMLPARAGDPDQASQSAAAPAPVAAAVSTTASAAASESVEGFLERLPTLSLGDQSTSVNARWKADASLESRFHLLPTMIRLFQEATKSDPEREPMLANLWKLFWTAENSKYFGWPRLSPQIVEAFTRDHRAPLLSLFCRILEDTEEPANLRQSLAHYLDARQRWGNRSDMDQHVEAPFRRILANHEEPEELRIHALNYVCGGAHDLQNLDPTSYRELRRFYSARHRQEVDLCVEMALDKKNPAKLRESAITFLRFGNPEEREIFLPQVLSICVKIFEDPTEPESLRLYFARSKKLAYKPPFVDRFLEPQTIALEPLFVDETYSYEAGDTTEFRQMCGTLLENPEENPEIRDWAARNLWRILSNDPRRMYVASGARADAHRQEAEPLFLDVLCAEANGTGEKLSRFLVKCLLHKQFDLEPLAERHVRVRDRLVGLAAQETTSPNIRRDIFEGLCLNEDPSISREWVFPHLPHFLEMSRPTEWLNYVSTLPFFVFHAMLRADALQREQIIQKLLAMRCYQGHSYRPDLKAGALGTCLQQWVEAGGTVDQPLDLRGVHAEIRLGIFHNYIKPLIVSGIMPLKLKPSLEELVKEAYPNDPGWIARAGLASEQRLLRETLGWLGEEAFQDEGTAAVASAAEGASASTDSIPTPPLALVMLSGVVLEDTMLRQRVERARNELAKAANPA